MCQPFLKPNYASARCTSNVFQIEHTRHRSPTNFLVHLFAGLIAYAKQPKRPSLDLEPWTESPQSTLLAEAELGFTRK
jgi:hypothetical protein